MEAAEGQEDMLVECSGAAEQRPGLGRVPEGEILRMPKWGGALRSRYQERWHPCARGCFTDKLTTMGKLLPERFMEMHFVSLFSEDLGVEAYQDATAMASEEEEEEQF